jgi:hypothetical protein
MYHIIAKAKLNASVRDNTILQIFYRTHTIIMRNVFSLSGFLSLVSVSILITVVDIIISIKSWIL